MYYFAMQLYVEVIQSLTFTLSILCAKDLLLMIQFIKYIYIYIYSSIADFQIEIIFEKKHIGLYQQDDLQSLFS